MYIRAYCQFMRQQPGSCLLRGQGRLELLGGGWVAVMGTASSDVHHCRSEKREADLASH